MSRQKKSAGSSRFGFFIAIIVCAYGGWAIWKYMPLRTQLFEFKEEVKTILKFSGANRGGQLTEQEMREEIMKKAKELKVPLDTKNLVVRKDAEKWHVTAHWDADYKIPGYSTKIAYSIDESWTNY